MLIGKNPLKEQPDWFKKNIEIIPLSNTVEVDDKNIKYFIWIYILIFTLLFLIK